MGDDNSATEAVGIVLGIVVAILSSMGAIWYSAELLATAVGM